MSLILLIVVLLLLFWWWWRADARTKTMAADPFYTDCGGILMPILVVLLIVWLIGGLRYWKSRVGASA